MPVINRFYPRAATNSSVARDHYEKIAGARGPRRARVTQAHKPAGREEAPLRTQSVVWAFVVIGLAAVAWLAWLAGGFLGLILVLVVALLVASFRWQQRAGAWRSGRPTRQRRRELDSAIAAKLPGFDRPETDPVEAWVRERSLYDLLDDRGNSSASSADPGS
jgi:hypothetical protein